MHITSAGEIGVGVTPESWTLFTPIQIGQSSSFVGRTSINQTDVCNNWYYDGSEKRINTGYAQRYVQDNSGDHYWLTGGSSSANSTISFSTPMIIKNDGNVGIGTTTPDFKFNVTKGYTSGLAKVAKFRSGNDATFVNFDTVQVVQTDVPCLAIIETPSGTQSDEQKLTFAVGDNKAIIGSTSTVTNGMSFYTNRAVTTTGFTREGNLTLHLANTGNVGIGRTDPNARLDIKAAGGSSGLTFETSDASSNQTFYINDGGTVGVRYYPFKIGVPSGTTNVANTRFQIATNGGNFVVLNDGKTGIGIDAPNEKLQVAGNVHAYEPSGIDAGLFASSAAGVTTIAIRSAGLTHFNGGAVGIGTTSPTTSLSVTDGASMYANSNWLVQIKRNATNGNDDTSKASILLANNSNAMQIAYGGSTDRLRFIDGGAVERFTMLNGGKIGIGKDNPQARLDIQDNDGTPLMTRTSSGLAMFHEISNGYAYLYLYQIAGGAKVVLSTNGNSYFVGGNLAVGATNPTSPTGVGTFLEIRGRNGIAGGTAGIVFKDYDNDAWDMWTSGGGLFVRYNNATEGWALLSNGNMGVGHTNPSAKLDVRESANNKYTAYFYNSDTGGQANGVNVQCASTNNDVYVLRANAGGDSNALVVSGAGNVGVGKYQPGYKLDVTGTIRATSDVIAFSDKRVKENIITIDNALNKVTKLRGVTYTRNDIDDKTTKIGVIAQEVLKVLPEVVKKDDVGMYSVAYGNMAGVFIEAIKELKAEVDSLKQEIKKLKK